MCTLNGNVRSVVQRRLDGFSTAGAIKMEALVRLSPDTGIAEQPLAFVAVLGVGALAWKAARSWVAFT